MLSIWLIAPVRFYVWKTESTCNQPRGFQTHVTAVTNLNINGGAITTSKVNKYWKGIYHHMILSSDLLRCSLCRLGIHGNHLLLWQRTAAMYRVFSSTPVVGHYQAERNYAILTGAISKRTWTFSKSCAIFWWTNTFFGS